MVFILLALVTQAFAKDATVKEMDSTQDFMHKSVDDLASKLADRLSDQVLNASSLHQADLDSTTFGKPGSVALSPQPSHFASARPSPASLLRGHSLPRVVARGVSQQRAAQAESVKPKVVKTAAGNCMTVATLAKQKAAIAKGDDKKAWELMEVADEAMSRRDFLAGLAFTMAAADLVVDDKKAEAAVEEVFQEAAVAAAPGVDWSAVLDKATKKALGGGKAGATAAVVQVISLMWLRTAMNYQYRYGGNLQSSLKKLTEEGGIPRLYQGLPFALVQGPLSRFGDTATNTGILALFEALPQAAGIPGPLRTAAASAAAGLWRIFCTPIDTAKTAMQVEGAAGLKQLGSRIAEQGPAPLFQGCIASAVATFAGNYPWFLTYNTLDGYLPAVSKEEVLLNLARSALLGVSASCVSDTVSNSLRVIKTTQQTAALGNTTGIDTEGGISIPQALKMVLETDGIKGLFGRGLQTRLLTNAVQGGLFSVLWRYFQTAGIR